ncbi:MAG: hypothetical protein JRN35_06140 [Nitrososphaerota archaeon]|nr:hypothetical protein [Nitrososphaerota archaeon]
MDARLVKRLLLAVIVVAVFALAVLASVPSSYTPAQGKGYGNLGPAGEVGR